MYISCSYSSWISNEISLAASKAIFLASALKSAAAKTYPHRCPIDVGGFKVVPFLGFIKTFSTPGYLELRFFPVTRISFPVDLTVR